MNVDTLRTSAQFLATSRETFARLLAYASDLTNGGREIDEHQVLTRRIASLATSFEAAESLLAFALKSNEASVLHEGSSLLLAPSIFAGEVCSEFFRVVDEHVKFQDGPRANAVGLEQQRALLRALLDDLNYQELGRRVLESGAQNDAPIFAANDRDVDTEALRSATRKFARTVVAPEAEAIHREDLLIPEHLIERMAELGYFGMSVPEEYGGVGMSNLMMVVATEELSAASLPVAGSLITRPEILAKALLQGGTENQKRKWLKPVATGKLMVAIAVTEPDIGSDVANLTCRATSATQNGTEGYVLNGSKAWCTFAGRAEVIALLARTDPDTALGHKGLSLFIVEKDAFTGHEFEMIQPGGGKLTGKADATVGYRGMHSFTLQFEDYFVPAENLVGGKDGEGRGFYLQMEGFAAGRLQTGGRAVGLAQASLEAAAKYAHERPQFGRPIAEFQNTQYEIGAMAVRVEAARQLTYTAARAMDRKADNATLLAAMAKLFAARTAVNVSQRAQLLHGGWGYAEEYAISRYVCDALVLPIFEGVEPILEMKVIGRTLLAR